MSIVKRRQEGECPSSNTEVDKDEENVGECATCYSSYLIYYYCRPI